MDKQNIQNLIEQNNILSSLDQKIKKIKFNEETLYIDDDFHHCLRGGGCGGSKKEKSDIQKLMENLKLPKNFLSNFEHHSNKIIGKAQQIVDDQYSMDEVMISIQWFHYNSEYFNAICQNENKTKWMNDLFENKFESFLQVLSNYLRGSCFLCYKVLQITNELLRVSFSFQLKNQKRELHINKQQLFLQYIEKFKNQIDRESIQAWKTPIEYEITLIEIMIMNCNTNSQVGKELLTNFVIKLVQSAIQLSPSDDLISSMIDGAKYLLKAGYEKVKYPIEVYQTFYFFQSLKWQIIEAVKRNLHIQSQILQLIEAYKQFIAESSNWIIHYCWIEMICDLISYRQIINKNQLTNDSNFSNQQDYWNQLLQNKIIKPLPYDNTEGVLQQFLNLQKFQTINFDLKQIINQNGKYQNFRIFIQSLIEEKFYEDFNLWERYQNFTFKQNDNKKVADETFFLFQENNLTTISVISKTLKHLGNEVKSQISSLQNLFKKAFINLTSLQQKLFENELESTTLEIQNKMLRILYVVFELSKIVKNEFCQQKLIQSKVIREHGQEKKLQQQIKEIQEIFKKSEEKINSDLEKQMNQTLDQIQDLQNTLLIIQANQKIKKFQIKQELKDNLSSISNFEFDKLDNYLKQFILDCQNFRKKATLILQNKSQQSQVTSSIPCQDFYNTIQILTQNPVFERYLEQSEIQINHFDSIEIQNFQDYNRETFKILQFQKIFINLIKVQFMNVFNILQRINQEINSNLLSDIKAHENQLEQLKDLMKDLFQKLLEIFSDKNMSQFEFRSSQIAEQAFSIVQNTFEIISSLENKTIEEEKNNALKQISLLQLDMISFVDENQSQQSCQEEFQKQIVDALEQWSENTKVIQQSDSNQSQKFESQDQDYQTFQLVMLNLEDQIENCFQKLNQLQISSNMHERIITSNQDGQFEEKQLKNQEKLLHDIKQNLIGPCEKLKKEISSLFKIENFEKNKQNLSEKSLLFIIAFPNEENQAPNIRLDEKYLEIVESTFQEKQFERSIFQFGNDYKVRECLIFNLIKIQACVNEEYLQKFIQQQIKQIWILERDEDVRSLLKNKELLEIQKKLFSSDLKSFTNQIKQEMKDRLEKMQSLEQAIRLEGNQQLRSKLQEQLQLGYQEMDQYIENIQDMSAQLNISLIFLKEISIDLKEMKTKIDSLSEAMIQIGDDVRKLRGKPYNELLVIRQQKVIQQAKLIELDSVYIPLKTIEYDIVNQKEKDTSELLVENYQEIKDNENFRGEVNEFIWKEEISKDVLLLKGPAGSGKSKASAKIEEFLWRLYSNQQSKWIPIYVSLPSLKNPKYNLFEQAMESEFYNFDSTQIHEFKEAIQNHQEQIVFILDSYDEMKSDCIQSNLIATNKFIQDFDIKEPAKYIKFIITTRDEILNSVEYRTWFQGNQISNLKEVQLKSFDEDQVNDYLQKYVELSVKRKIRDTYELIQQLKEKQIDLQEFQNIWLMVVDFVVKCNKKLDIEGSERLFQNKEEEVIIQKLRNHSILKFIKDEQVIFLRKDLQSLWSSYMYQKSIRNLNVDQLLSNPFLLEIVAQVLPDMIKQQSGSSQFKAQFLNNLQNTLKSNKLSQKLIKKYSQNNQIIKQDSKEKDQQHESFEEEFKEANRILDLLESQKFFQNYSIVDKIILGTEGKFFKGKSEFNVGTQVESVIMALKQKQFTIYEFYKGFVNFYHDQQISKLRKLGKISNIDSFTIDVFQFSQSLAIDLTINQLTQVIYQQKGKLKLNLHFDDQQQTVEWDKYFNDMDDYQEYKKLIRSCVLLNIKGINISFVHKSIQEFLVANYIYEFLQQVSKKCQIFTEKNQVFLKNSLFNQNEFNISHEHYQGSIRLLKQELENLDQIDETLINIVKLSKQNGFIRCASNSIFLLSHRQTFLGACDFDSIKLKDTNISFLSFFGSDLSSSVFENVAIDSCNFNHCNLNNVNWSNIVCKEKPYLIGHKNTVNIVSFSHDGNKLASGGADELVIIWNLNTFEEISRITEHKSEITCVKFICNSQRIVTAGKDSIIKIFNLENLPKYELMNELIDHLDPIVQIVLSQDEKHMYSLDSSGYVIIWKTENIYTSQNCLIGEDGCKITDVVFTQNGNYLFAIDSGQQKISCYDVQNKKCINFISTYNLKPIKLTLSRNDIYLATYNENNELLVWNVFDRETFKLIYYEKNVQKIKDISFSPDNQVLSTLGDNIVLNRKINKLNTFDIWIEYKNCNCLFISQCDDLYAFYRNDKIEILDYFTDQTINSIETKDVEILEFSKINCQLAVKDKFSNVQIWDLYTVQMKSQQKIDFLNYQKLILSNNFKQILQKQSSFVIINEIEKFASFEDSNDIVFRAYNFKRIAVKPYKQMIASARLNYITIIDLQQNGQKNVGYLEFQTEVSCLSFSQDRLYVGFKDGTILYKNETIDQYEDFQKLEYEIEYLGISDDYNTLACQIGQSILIFDLITKAQIFKNDRILGYPKNIIFNPNNQNIACQYDREIVFLNYRSKEEIVKEDFESSIIDITYSSYFENYFFTLSKKELIIWDQSNLLVKTIDLQERQDLQFVFFIQKNTLVIASQNIIRLWEISNDLILTLKSSKYLSNIEDIGVFQCSQQIFINNYSYSYFNEEVSYHLINIEQFDDIIVSLPNESACYEVSNNWNLLAFGNGNQICLNFVGQFRPEYKLDNEAKVQVIGFSKDDNILASFGNDNYLKL